MHRRGAQTAADRKHTGISRRLVGLVAAMVASIVVIVAWVSGHARTLALSQAETLSRNLVISLEQHAARTLEAADLSLRYIGSRISAEGGPLRIDGQLAHHLLKELADNSPQIRSLFVVDESGMPLHDSGAVPSRLNASLADRDYFTAHRDGNGDTLYIGHVYRNRLNGLWTQVLSRRLNHLDGSFAGIVLGTVDPTYFSQFYRQIDVGSTGNMTLVSSAGQVLIRHPWRDEEIGSSVAESRLFDKEMLGSGSGIYEERSPDDGLERIFAFRAVQGRPMIAVVSIAKDEVLAAWWGQTWTLSAAAAAIIAFMSLLALLFARTLRRHLASSAILQATLDNMDQGLTMVGADQRVVVCNERARQLLELPSDLMATCPTTRAVLDYQWQRGEFDGADAATKALMSEGGEGPDLYVRTRPNGTVIEVRSVPMRGGGLVRTYTDITARSKAEAAQEQSEARYRLLADSTSDVITHLRLSDFHRTYVSPSCTALLGYEPQEMLDQRPTETNIHPDDALAVRACAGRLARGELDRERVTYRAKHKAGHWIWVEASLSLVRDAGSRTPSAIVCSLRDITDRKQAEDAMRFSEARYRLLAENASDIVVHNTPDMRRRYVSPSCRDVLGREPEDLIGKFVAEIMHPEDVPFVMATQRGVVAGVPQTEPMTYRLQHRDGHWVWVEATFRRIDTSDINAGIVGTIRDVTERRRQAEDLRQAKLEAEAATRAKTDFLASMSHEIRTPLNGVLGYTDLLLEDPGIDASQRRKLERIQFAGTALLGIVNDVLDFSKVEAGQIELDLAPFYTNALIDNTTSIVRGLAEAKRLDLRIDLDPDAPAVLLGDLSRLRQILLNFLNNAIKFTASGHVTVSVRQVRPASDTPFPTDPMIRFAVTDTGIGIAEDKRTRLFKRFSQVDSSITRQFGGTGLGLAISKSLVELMGGEIGVESTFGEGSTFWFTACLPAGAMPSAEPSMPSSSAVRCLDILLVEDVEINREVACSVLERAGHRVSVACDGAAAVAAVQGNAYDLVLMDIQMPIMDGISATRHIRALTSVAARVPIIALTANVLPLQISEIRAAGMNDHVGKPFKRDELLAVVERWAGRQGGMPVQETASEPGRIVFDRDTFGLLLEDIGAATMSSLLGKLQRQLAHQLATVAEQMADRKGLGRQAHSTVSSAGFLGFTALSKACHDLENACNGEAENLEGLVAETTLLKTETIAVIDNLLTELSIAA